MVDQEASLGKPVLRSGVPLRCCPNERFPVEVPGWTFEFSRYFEPSGRSWPVRIQSFHRVGLVVGPRPNCRQRSSPTPASNASHRRISSCWRSWRERWASGPSPSPHSAVPFRLPAPLLVSLSLSAAAAAATTTFSHDTPPPDFVSPFLVCRH